MLLLHFLFSTNRINLKLHYSDFFFLFFCFIYEIPMQRHSNIFCLQFYKNALPRKTFDKNFTTKKYYNVKLYQTEAQFSQRMPKQKNPDFAQVIFYQS